MNYWLVVLLDPIYDSLLQTIYELQLHNNT